MSESAVQRSIIDTLVYDGWLAIRVNAGGMVQEDANGGRRYVRFGIWQAIGFSESDAGYSDVIATKGGQTLFVEVKGKRGRQRESQKAFQAAVESVGGIYLLASSVEALRPYLERVQL
jgi:Holliday junction resolvase